MGNFKNWVWFLLFGSLWGFVEVVAEGTLLKDNMPYASVMLAAWAFLVLAVGRRARNTCGLGFPLCIGKSSRIKGGIQLQDL